MVKANHRSGFTLIEILVVVVIITIIATALLVTQTGGNAKARDAQRKADLQNLRTAIELYKKDNGRYPARCPVAGENWSGQIGTDYECDDGSGIYIQGLAEYMPVLPKDPKLNGADSGYVYTTNSAGTVYKIMAKNTVEVENVNKANPFKSCDVSDSSSGICDETHPSNSTPGHCYEPSAGPGGADLDGTKDTQFDNSYGLWGGYAETTARPDAGNYDTLIERYTEDVICDIQ